MPGSSCQIFTVCVFSFFLPSKYCPAGCLTSTEEISGTIPNGYREVSAFTTRMHVLCASAVFPLLFLVTVFSITFAGESRRPHRSPAVGLQPLLRPPHHQLLLTHVFCLSAVLQVCVSSRLIQSGPTSSLVNMGRVGVGGGSVVCESRADDLTAPPCCV